MALLFGWRIGIGNRWLAGLFSKRTSAAHNLLPYGFGEIPELGRSLLGASSIFARIFFLPCMGHLYFYFNIRKQ
jgi:hypothetical protein